MGDDCLPSSGGCPVEADDSDLLQRRKVPTTALAFVLGGAGPRHTRTSVHGALLTPHPPRSEPKSRVLSVRFQPLALGFLFFHDIPRAAEKQRSARPALLTGAVPIRAAPEAASDDAQKIRGNPRVISLKKDEAGLLLTDHVFQHGFNAHNEGDAFFVSLDSSLISAIQNDVPTNALLKSHLADGIINILINDIDR
jgi:hypothetical protein